MPTNPKDYAVTMRGSCKRYTGSNPIPTETTGHVSRQATRGATYTPRRRKPVERWIPPTNYSMTEWSLANPSGECLSTGPSGTIRFEGVLGPAGIPNAVAMRGTALTQSGGVLAFPAELTNRALIDARLKLKDTDLDLGVAFGERRETARFVGDTLDVMADVVRTYRDVRKMRPKEAKRHLKRLWRRLKRKKPEFKKVPDYRLTWQYAIKPLASDIWNACKALDDHSRDKWKVTAKGKAAYRHVVSKQIQKGTSSASFGYCLAVGEVEHKAFCRIDAQPANDALRKASQCGLTNPVNLGWELLPLSFVVDWAWPLGDYFSQFDALFGWEILGCSQSNFSKERFQFTGLNDQIGSTKTTNAWKARYYRVDLDRSASTTVPFADLPSFRDPTASNHVIDGLALLAQALKGIARR